MTQDAVGPRGCQELSKVTGPVRPSAARPEFAGPCRIGVGQGRTLGPMGLQGFERRLERLVEGTFNKAFRSGLQPVEIAPQLVRVLDNGRTLGVRGPFAPEQHRRLPLAQPTPSASTSFADALERELAEAARQHAREEGYQFLGPVDRHHGVGRLVEARAPSTSWARSPRARAARSARWSCPTAAGSRLGSTPPCSAATPTAPCRSRIPAASRRHAEIRAHRRRLPRRRPRLDERHARSTASRCSEHVLHDGDEIAVGARGRCASRLRSARDVRGLLTILKFCFLALALPVPVPGRAHRDAGDEAGEGPDRAGRAGSPAPVAAPLAAAVAPAQRRARARGPRCTCSIGRAVRARSTRSTTR